MKQSGEAATTVAAGGGRGTRWFAVVVYATTALTAAIVAATAVAGVIDSMPLAAAVGAIAAVGMAGWLRHRLAASPAALAEVPPLYRGAFAAGVVAVLGQLAVLTTFIVDPYVSTWPASPMRPWQSAHSCLSAYWVAAQHATVVPDLYVDDAVYRPPIVPGVARRPTLGPFFVDAFEYPPTFLPVPRLLARTVPDFWGFRRLWFALNLAGVTLGLVAIARRVDRACGTHAVWLTPWAIAAPSIIGTFQAGNVQLLCIVASAFAMLLFERRRHALGGLVLGYAIVSKLYPGVLVLFLLLRGDWRAVGWTAVAGVALVGVTVLDLGTAPMAAFLTHLPSILSGEAFPGLRAPFSIAANESVPGIAFKLGLYGVPGMGFEAAQVVGWAYTLVLVATVVWLARVRGTREHDPLLWVAILILATLRSPFLPQYGAFPAMWLATLLAPLAGERRAVTMCVGLWLVLAAQAGQNALPVPLNAAVTLSHTLASLVLVYAVVPRTLAASRPGLTPRSAYAPT